MSEEITKPQLTEEQLKALHEATTVDMTDEDVALAFTGVARMVDASTSHLQGYLEHGDIIGGFVALTDLAAQLSVLSGMLASSLLQNSFMVQDPDVYDENTREYTHLKTIEYSASMAEYGWRLHEDLVELNEKMGREQSGHDRPGYAEPGYIKELAEKTDETITKFLMSRIERLLRDKMNEL